MSNMPEYNKTFNRIGQEQYGTSRNRLRFRRLGDAYWQIPASMLGSFVAGAILALVHHFFYAFMNGKEATADGQTWVLRGGNVLAYIVRVLLIAACGIAYVQWLWQDMTSKPTNVAELDTMFSILEDVSKFMSPLVWIKRPLLLLLAIATWVLPLVAIIPPGAISVGLAEKSIPRNLSLEFAPFSSPNVVTVLNTTDNKMGLVTYGGSAFTLGFLTTFLAKPQPIKVPSANLTFEDSFFGPAVSCEEADNFTSATIAQETYEEAQALQTTVTLQTRFLTSLPNDTSLGLTKIGLLQQGSAGPRNAFNDYVSPEAASVYLTFAPKYLHLTGNKNDVMTLRCALYNASWNIQFDTQSNGEQTLRPNKLTFQNYVPGAPDVANPTQDDFEHYGYVSLMAMFTESVHGQTVQVPDTGRNTSDRALLSIDSALSSGDSVYERATEEWGAINAAKSLNATVSETRGSKSGVREDAVLKPVLRKELEDLMLNLTMSVRYGVLPSANPDFVAPGLRPNRTINATETIIQTVFQYHPLALALTYSFGLLITLLSIILGALAMADSGKAYANSFSSIARVNHNQRELNKVIKSQFDYSGAEPVPKDILNAYISVGEHLDTVHEFDISSKYDVKTTVSQELVAERFQDNMSQYHSKLPPYETRTFGG